MLKFKEFCEQTLYRGYQQEHGVRSNSPFVWFSYDEELAKEYSIGRGDNGIIAKIEYTPKNPLKLHKAEVRWNIGEFIGSIMSQTKLNKRQIKNIRDKAIKMIDELREKYGDTRKPLYEFWDNDQTLADFIDLMGFDSIKNDRGWSHHYRNKQKIFINRNN